MQLIPSRCLLFTFRAALLSAGLVLAGCDAGPPTGQVVADVGGTEVTVRELREEMSAGRGAVSGFLPESAPGALDILVARKVLYNEAVERGLESDGEFHFALRKAREDLLVEALKRDIRRSIEPPGDSAVADYLDSKTWRFRDRFILQLSAVDPRQEPANAQFDSTAFLAPPPRTIMAASTGDTVELGGKKWRVDGKQRLHLSSDEMVDQARRELAERAVETELQHLVENFRQRGQIRYQSGYGPAAR